VKYAGKAMLLALAVAAGSLALDAAIAQGRGGNGQGQQQGQQQQGRSGGQGQGPVQGPGRGSGPVMQQAEIRDRLRTRDIYGRDLMSNEEQRQYRDRVNAATSDREWARIRQEHMNEIRARAQSQGRPLDPPIYGEYMLTRQERNEYQKRIGDAQSDAERARIRNEHQQMVQDRARLLGLSPPPTD